jgi:hypothetical protein
MREEITFSIWQKAAAKSLSVKISQIPSAKLPLTQKGQAPTDQFAPIGIFQKPSEKFPFTLSWSHYALFDWLWEQEAVV